MWSLCGERGMESLLVHINILYCSANSKCATDQTEEAIASEYESGLLLWYTQSTSCKQAKSN